MLSDFVLKGGSHIHTQERTFLLTRGVVDIAWIQIHYNKITIFEIKLTMEINIVKSQIENGEVHTVRGL